jgi:uncharacterized protein DUF4276
MAPTEGVTLGLIVEGRGETEAAPTLIRHIAREFSFHASIKCEVRRIPKSQLVQPEELERAVEALTRQIGRNKPILVLLDADDDCPKDLASSLKARCDAAHADVNVSIVIAKNEYEAWFLAAAKSLAGQRGLAEQLAPPIDPESIQGAKEWLTAHMSSYQSYSPTRHQSAYSDLMDMAEARTAPSFRKLEKELARLLRWN